MSRRIQQDESGRPRERELVLAPNEYAYVLDTTKGHINCYVGPNKTSLAQTDQLVVFNYKTKRFEAAEFSKAVRLFATAPANWYMILKNPAEDGRQPKAGISNTLGELKVGVKVNLGGPVSFPLWPGQMVKIIKGHRLKSNQYLYIQVYDTEAATKNWQAVLGLSDREAAGREPPHFESGQKMIIKGADASFYVPPTGVEVIPDHNGDYVRDAVTLQRLDYCVLIGEDGRRSYVRGEAVVFPHPSQKFLERNGRRRFQAIELSEISGIHIKVIKGYSEPDGTERSEGQELFLTGKNEIYFPREEHAIIRYGDRDLHYAVAIPKGEGVYLLNRLSGEVRLVTGPRMLLPDPRTEVVTRRVLSDRECRLLYPGNEEALAYNRGLRQNRLPRGEAAHTGRMLDEKKPPRRARKSSESGLEVPGFSRGSQFTGPRTVTLDTKYSGCVSLDVWSGYAVQVVNKAGERRVEQGPATVLLEYDEALEALTLSTGTPKTDDRLLETVFLQTAGNKVSDCIELVTNDMVRARLNLQYRVDFMGDDPSRWFAVSNYVKLLCDHASSRVKAAARQTAISELRSDITAIVRNLLLGAKQEDGGRRGLIFDECALRVYDVEVLELEVLDQEVDEMLWAAQKKAIEDVIQVTQRESRYKAQRRLEELERDLARASQETALLQMALEEARRQREHEADRLKRERAILMEKMVKEAELARAQQEAEITRQRVETHQLQHAADVKRRADLQELALADLRARVEGAVTSSKAFSPELVSALNKLGDEQLLAALAENFGELAAVEGKGLLKTAQRFLDFVPGSLLPQLAHRTEGDGADEEG